jgi:hypothetical protein
MSPLEIHQSPVLRNRVPMPPPETPCASSVVTREYEGALVQPSRKASGKMSGRQPRSGYRKTSV